MVDGCACPPEERDFLLKWRATAFLWRIPEAAFFLAFFLPAALRPWVWALCLTWAGVSCVANALRCRRLHCYLTGPFFLLGALSLLLFEAAPVRLPIATPLWIAVAEVMGAILLIFLPEYVGGRYARPAAIASSGG